MQGANVNEKAGFVRMRLSRLAWAVLAPPPQKKSFLPDCFALLVSSQFTVDFNVWDNDGLEGDRKFSNVVSALLARVACGLQDPPMTRDCVGMAIVDGSIKRGWFF